MAQLIKADICVIGAGSAGLTVAAGAAQMGARTVLIEAARMGGDCLNTGCVPSKALLAAAKVAQSVRTSRRFGVEVPAPVIRFSEIHRRVHDVIGAIAPHDSVERFSGLGCTVIQASARFIDGDTVDAGDYRIKARRFVVATGSRASIPPVPGLDCVAYFTNESIFDNETQPQHLVVIGAGPIGCEMAQAHRRLGAAVTVIDMGAMLPKDDPEAAAVLRQRFAAEGIAMLEGARINRVERQPGGISVVLSDGASEHPVEGSHLLIAAGRKANVETLDLEAAGVAYNAKGIVVDSRLRSSNKHIFAAGDVAGGYQFTHVAGYHAGIVLRNALFRLPARNAPTALPWVTYTDPELAQVGLTEKQAIEAHGNSIRVLRASFADNDRAEAEGSTDGFLKAMVSKRGQILGCTIVGPHAGELIQPWVLAIAQRLKIGAIASMIAPYPTLGEISKRAAFQFYEPKLFSTRTKMLVRFLGAFG